MYCIECGLQIPENSKYCPHCGKQQTEVEPVIKETISEINKGIIYKVIQTLETLLSKDFLKKARGYYLAWVLLHLGLLLIGSQGIFEGYNMGVDRFWPFNSGYDKGLDKYDITEFLVYTTFPLAILIVWSIIRTQQNENKDKHNTTSNK